jgi:hypothetical protein
MKIYKNSWHYRWLVWTGFERELSNNPSILEYVGVHLLTMFICVIGCIPATIAVAIIGIAWCCFWIFEGFGAACWWLYELFPKVEICDVCEEE